MRGGLTVFVPMHPSDAMRCDQQTLLGNGERLHNGSVMILKPGSEFCIAATGSHRWCSIFVPYELLTASHVPVTKPAQNHHVLLPSIHGRELQSRVESLSAILRDAPDSLCSTSAIAATKEKITEAVATAFSCNSNAATHPGRPSLSRTSIVQAALHVIEDHPEEHLSVWKLSTLVGVSERTLRTAFEQYFGVGPTKYLKIRILREARKLLRTADPFSKNVTDVAVGLGIWEFGRFSRDYKMLFGELPSDSLHNKVFPDRTVASR